MEIVSRLIFFFIFSFLFLSACDSPEVIRDLNDASYELSDQDNATVDFPQDFRGDFLVVGFVYTNCPDVCPLITANMVNIYNELPDNSDVHFVEITFDPERDTPSVLRQYAGNYRLDEDKFTLLTGQPQTVDSLLSKLDIEAEISYTKTTDEGKELYFMNHTNRILIMDKQGRVRMEYPGSAVTPEIIIEDIQLLR